MTREEIIKSLDDYIEANKDNSKNHIKAPLIGKISEKIIKYKGLTSEELAQALDNKNEITPDGFFIMSDCEYSTEKQGDYDLTVTYKPIYENKCWH